MVVPADPTAHLVVREPRLALRFLEHLLDAVPLHVDTHELRERHIARRVRERIPHTRAILDAPDHHQSLLGADPLLVLRPDAGPDCLDLDGASLPVADLEALPA